MARETEFQQIAVRILDAALRAQELEIFKQSLKEVIKARGGFTIVARSTGLARTSMYGTLSTSGNPQLSTVIALLHAVGLRLAVEPLDKSESG